MKIRLLFLFVLMLLPLASVKAQIVNAGFETGNLAGWMSGGTGSVQILTSGDLSSVTAPEGAFYALVSNGPGDVGSDSLPDLGTLTSAPFTLTRPMSLSLSWDFLTAEFTGVDSDPTRLDRFEIALLPQSGEPIVLASGNVEESQPFYLIDSGSAVSAPDGSAFFERLGFQTEMSHIDPGTYSLRFTVMDAGDGSFDSALALDDIRFSPLASAAPEPGTQGLLLLGLAGVTPGYLKLHKKASSIPLGMAASICKR